MHDFQGRLREGRYLLAHRAKALGRKGPGEEEDKWAHLHSKLKHQCAILLIFQDLPALDKSRTATLAVC